MIAYKDKGLDVVCKHLLGGNMQRPSAVRREKAAAPRKKTETNKD